MRIQGTDVKTIEERRQQLRSAIGEEWEYELREAPEFATIIGDYRYNDRWSDPSLSHVEQQKRDLADWLSRFEAIDATGFPEQEVLDHRLMVRDLKERLEAIELKNHEMLIDQLDGVHLMLAQLPSLAPFDSAEHYEDYITRLHKLPHLLEQVIEVLKQGAEDELTQPRYLLEKTFSQCRSIAEPPADANVFGRPATSVPHSIAAADRQRLYDELVSAVEEQVRPAYQKLASFIADEYAPRGRIEPGLWALPDGDARYRFHIRELTTTNMDPDAIHSLGLQEVARIESEQLAIARDLGFSDLKTFRESLRTNQKLIPTSREQILDTYRHYIDQMESELPKLFGLLPKTRLEVRSVQEYREKEAAGAEYYQGTPDGSRPGIVYVNTADREHRSLISAESTAYHEGLPGHHLQISIAQSLPDLPPFRQQASYIAYMEGWALYSERLGKDIGFYQDPYSDFGRLSGELLRAVRLVLDTGVHHQRWTRQQMVDYFREHSSAAEPDLQAEIDRYIAHPAQALTYKLGQLEILKLRKRAQKELGSYYDVRTFHDKMLDGGALPLNVLHERVSAWIERQRATDSLHGGRGVESSSAVTAS